MEQPKETKERNKYSENDTENKMWEELNDSLNKLYDQKCQEWMKEDIKRLEEESKEEPYNSEYYTGMYFYDEFGNRGKQYKIAEKDQN